MGSDESKPKPEPTVVPADFGPAYGIYNIDTTEKPKPYKKPEQQPKPTKTAENSRQNQLSLDHLSQFPTDLMRPIGHFVDQSYHIK